MDRRPSRRRKKSTSTSDRQSRARRHRPKPKESSSATPLLIVSGLVLMIGGAFFLASQSSQSQSDEVKRRRRAALDQDQKDLKVFLSKSKRNAKPHPIKKRTIKPKRKPLPNVDAVAERLIEAELRIIAQKNAAIGRVLTKDQILEVRKMILKPARFEASVYVAIYRIGRELNASQKIIDQTISRWTEAAQKGLDLSILTPSIRKDIERSIQAEKAVNEALRE